MYAGVPRYHTSSAVISNVRRRCSTKLLFTVFKSSARRAKTACSATIDQRIKLCLSSENKSHTLLVSTVRYNKALLHAIPGAALFKRHLRTASVRRACISIYRAGYSVFLTQIQSSPERSTGAICAPVPRNERATVAVSRIL